MTVASTFDLAYFGPGLFARSVASTLFHWMGMLDPGLSEASRTRQGRGQANRSGFIQTSDAIGSARSLGCLAVLVIACILP